MGEWISVNDKLPKDTGTVLIAHKCGVSFGWFNGTYWTRGAATKHRPIRTVTHWMPLPEPPNGDNMNEIDKAIKFLREQYERAERIDAIYNPLAWALYQTWRHVDEPPKEG